MKLTIVAATGRLGRRLLEQALAGGHDVTAVVRTPQKLGSAQARVVAADLATTDPAMLEPAFRGADAVLSALGPRNRSDTGVTSAGTRAIVQAMLATDARRLLIVSAAPVGTVPSPTRPHPPRHDPGDGPLVRYLGAPLVRALLGRLYVDLAMAESLVTGSGLDWTIVRPPRLTERPGTGNYRTAYGRNLRGGVTISRSDLAHYMLAAVDQPDAVGRIVGIAR